MLEVLLDEYVSHVAVYRDHLEVEVIGSPTAHASTGTARLSHRAIRQNPRHHAMRSSLQDGTNICLLF